MNPSALTLPGIEPPGWDSLTPPRVGLALTDTDCWICGTTIDERPEAPMLVIDTRRPVGERRAHSLCRYPEALS